MNKFGKLLFVTLGIVSTTALAEPFLFQPTPNKAPTPANLAANPPPPMSAEEFTKQVDINSKQAQKELFQSAKEFNQAASTLPLPTKPPIPLDTKLTPSNSGPVPSDTADEDSKRLFATEPPREETPPTNPTLPNSATNATPPVVSAPAPVVVTPPPQAPAQNQNYTGFGAGNTNTNAPAAPAPAGGGWNIKY